MGEDILSGCIGCSAVGGGGLAEVRALVDRRRCGRWLIESGVIWRGCGVWSCVSAATMF
jgi:hypothetical protein